jgi:hypothetical protein
MNEKSLKFWGGNPPEWLMFNSDITSEYVKLGLWGGTHIFDVKTKTYTLDRDCGFFSNFTVQLYGIVKFILMGYTPENLGFILNDYEPGYNFYSDLFEIQQEEINIFEYCSIEEIDVFMRYCEPSHLGLGRKKEDINYKIINAIIDKYFRLSDSSKKIYDEIITKYDFDFDNTTFIWARKTDKVSETSVPSAETYYKILSENNLLNTKIILQTDDLSVIKEFDNLKISYDTLDELPYSENNEGFHVNIKNISNEDFEKKYGVTKLQHLQKLLSLAMIASKFKNVIIYPGNLASVIPIFRKNFNNVYSFINSTNLIS